MSSKNGVPYRVWLIPSSKYSLKAPNAMSPKKITYHNTDNQMPAHNEISYMRDNNNVTSYHIAVDEKEAVQGLPFNRNGWHSGDGGNGYGNRNTIGIEICRNYDRARKTTNLIEPLKSQYSQAEINAVKVGAQIMYEQGIAPTLGNIRFHQEWSGKNCPSKILNERRGSAFKALAVAEAVKYKAKMEGKPVTPSSQEAKWIKNATGWWYRNSNGSYPKSQWQLIGGKWYLFDSKGYMLTGWQEVKGTWYHMNNSGAMQIGWIKLGENWYYLHTNGAMKTGWQKIKDVWYYMNDSGRMQTGWLKLDTRWFYLNSSGVMQTGLITINEKQYYLKENGEMASDEEVKLMAGLSGDLG